MISKIGMFLITTTGPASLVGAVLNRLNIPIRTVRIASIGTVIAMIILVTILLKLEFLRFE